MLHSPTALSQALRCLLPTDRKACRSAAVTVSEASAAAAVLLKPGCFALVSSALGPRGGRGVQGRGMVRWRRSAYLGDVERVCVCVCVLFPAPHVRCEPDAL